MTDALLLMLFDAALRGMLLALLLLLAWVLGRDRPRLPAARAALAMMLGLTVQVISSTPQFEAQVPRLWQAPLVAVSVGNAVLFWIFVQALFDDDFRLRPLHAAAWLAVAALAGFNCVVMAPGSSVLGRSRWACSAAYRCCSRCWPRSRRRRTGARTWSRGGAGCGPSSW